jgi:hypothetical protein
MTQTEALKLALDALEYTGLKWPQVEEAITAIKAALEAKDEPVAWMDASRLEELRNGFTVMTTLTKKKAFFDDVAIYTTPQQQEAKGEPVAWRDAAIRLGEELSSVGPDSYYDMNAKEWLDWAMKQKPRGEHSLPQRTWVKLTDEQFLEACKIAEGGNYMVAFQRIQQWLKKNNT